MTDTATPVTIKSNQPVEAGDVDMDQLQSMLDYIRPAIQMDGGDIVLLGVDDAVVNLQMVGACGGCPMSMMTLKSGIERILTERVPGVTAVEAEA